MRQKLGLKAGDSVAFKFKGGQIFLQYAHSVDQVFANAVEDTLKDEWHPEHDERAYADLQALRCAGGAVPVHGQLRREAPPVFVLSAESFNDRAGPSSSP